MLLVDLIKKELTIELRSKESLVLIFSLSILFSVLTSFGVSSAFLNPETTAKIFPLLAWLLFLFTATVSIGRTYEYEIEHMAIEGVILSGASLTQVYIAKVVSNFLIMFIAQLFSLILLAILLDLDILSKFLTLTTLSAPVVFAYSALSSLVLAISSTSKLKQMLLPLILLPLLFPLFFAALELTPKVLSDGVLDVESFWFTLLLSLDLLYLLLGINLYRFVVRE